MTRKLGKCDFNKNTETYKIWKLNTPSRPPPDRPGFQPPADGLAPPFLKVPPSLSTIEGMCSPGLAGGISSHHAWRTS